ncbi:MAG: GFA family protein [Paracoccaceae bacterium]
MHGSCLCGAVAFDITGPARDVWACHCTQCRKWSGHFWAASSAALTDFHLIRQGGLAWYRASPTAKRGFCRDCGASLFWIPDGEDRIAFAPGALDAPTGLALTQHIFVEDAGDYYTPEGPPPAPDVSQTAEILSASCLCGQCAFSLPGPAGAVTACHCTQCRKLSGHFSASFDAPEAALTWQSNSPLAEYQTPGGGQRGFCTHCGSSLYFRAANGDFSVEAGIVDTPTGGRLTRHIFTADQGDYYALTDGLPQVKAGE